MGRGLSDLQQWILRRASGQKQLINHEILSGFFGWRYRRRGPHPEDNKFSPGNVGDSRYHSVHVVVSRSCLRLSERGLVERWHRQSYRWSSVKITDAGKQWVQTHPAVK